MSPLSSDLTYDGFFHEAIDEGQAFTLLDMRHGGKRKTEYGRTDTVHLKVPTPSKPEGAWLSIIGESIQEEVDNMSPKDFPLNVVVERRPTRTPGQTVKVLRGAQTTDPVAVVKDPPAAPTPTPNVPAAPGGYGQAPGSV